MKLLDLYTSILRATGHDVTDDGYIETVLDDIRQPTLVEGHRLVLPVKQHLDRAGTSDNIMFHPMNEDLMRGPSKVLEYFRKAATINLESHISMLMLAMFRIIASTADHDKLSPDQAVILDVGKKTTEGTIERFIKIIKALKSNSRTESLVHIYLKRSGKLGEESFRQLATVTFPLYDRLIENPKEVLGVKLRIADQEAIREVFEYVFPLINTSHGYSYGSNSSIAPKFEAISGAILNISAACNEVTDLLDPHMPMTPSIESDWGAMVGKYEDFVNEVRMTPMQRGNEGEASVHDQGFKATEPDTVPVPAKPAMQSTTPPWQGQTNTVPAMQPVTPTPTPAPASYQTPVPTPQPHVQAQPTQPYGQPNRSTSGSDPKSVLSALRMQAQGFVPGQPMTGHYAANTPQMQVPQPGYPVQQMGHFVPNQMQQSVGYPNQMQMQQPMMYPNQMQQFPAPMQQQFGHNAAFGYYGQPVR